MVHGLIIDLLLIPRVEGHSRAKLWLGSAGFISVALAMILPPMPQGILQLFADIVRLFKQVSPPSEIPDVRGIPN
jgi:hypothetical protein